MDSKHNKIKNKKQESSIQPARDELEVAKKYHDFARKSLVEAEKNFREAEKLLKRAEKKLDIIEIASDEEDNNYENDVGDQKPAAVTVDTATNGVAASARRANRSGGGAVLLRSGTTATDPPLPSSSAQAQRRRTWIFISTGNDDYKLNTRLGTSKQFAESAIRVWKSGDDQTAKRYLRLCRNLCGLAEVSGYDSNEETEKNITAIVAMINTQALLNANRRRNANDAGLSTAAARLPPRQRRRVDDTNNVLGMRLLQARIIAGSTATASMAEAATTTYNKNTETET